MNVKSNTAGWIASRIGAWVNATAWKDIPASVIHQAKRCLIDVVGVTAAGARWPSVAAARSALRPVTASGVCSVVGRSRERLSAPGAAFLNAMAAHVLDFDDTCYDGIVHGSAAVWPAALAAAESSGSSGRVFLLAFILGVEAEYALGRMLGDRLYWKGWWNSGVLGAIGASAAASKAFRLGPEATQNAVRIATCLTTGPKAIFGTPIKPAAMGWASETGVRAALLARQGLAGPEGAFEDSRGFLRLYNDGRCNRQELATLGGRFSLVSPGVALKLFPVCSAAQAAAEAVQELIQENELKAADIKRVHCTVTPLVDVSLVYDRPASVAQAQFSMPFAVGCILTYNELGIRQLDESCLADEALVANMRKVSMTRGKKLVTGKQLETDFPEAAKVTLITHGGRRFQRFNGAATGMPVKPMSDAQVDAKFLACAAGPLGRRRAARLLDRLWSIEKIRDLRDLRG